MDITNENRDKAYKTATEQQRYLYSSPKSGKQMRSIANKYNIVSPEQYRNYAILVGDLILNLVNRSELTPLLVKTLSVDKEQGLKITDDLLNFLDQPPVISTETDSILNMTSEIAEVEAALNSVPQLRTMNQDMAKSQPQEEVTYSTSQENILKRGVENKTDDNTPRWGNQT